MEIFTIQANDILRRNIQAFYHTTYTGYNQPDNPNYINTLKNTFNSTSVSDLKQAVQQLRGILVEDLPQILNIIGINPLINCVVPRAKADQNYVPNQLLFKKTVKAVINKLDGFIDGSDYIIRQTDTKTTHLTHSPSAEQYAGNGSMPYEGITNDTCRIYNVRGKNILLIDDIYTGGVNTDEDAIQTLLDKGARSVSFYAVGKTAHRRENFQVIDDIPF